MKNHWRKSTLFSALALALVAAGCGSDKHAPLGPSTVRTTPGLAAGAPEGAGVGVSGFASTRSGEIEFKGRVDAVAPPDLTVSGVTVHTDGATEIKRNGRRIALTDLSAGETVKVEGTLLGDGTVLAREIEVDDDQVEFTGTVDSVSSPDLQVNGITVHTDGNTRITRKGRGITLADVKAGETVAVDGVLLPDGSVLARRLQAGEDADDDEVEFLGIVQSITPPSLTVSGVNVLTDANTEIERDDHKISLTDLQVGEIVQVEGVLLPDGTVLAHEIKADKDKVEFAGTIEAITPPGLVVNGINVTTDAKTRITKDCARVSLADLAVGDRVEIEGILLPDGTVLARRIKAGECVDDDDSDGDSDDDSDGDSD